MLRSAKLINHQIILLSLNLIPRFAVIYKHLEGDLAVVLDFLIDQSLIKLRANHERVMKDIQTMIGIYQQKKTTIFDLISLFVDAKLKAAVAAPSTETINIVEALGKLFDSVKKVFEQYNYIEQVEFVSSIFFSFSLLILIGRRCSM